MSELQSESPESKDKNVHGLESASDSTVFDGGVLPVDEHIEEVVGEDGCKTPHRGIYLLPNLFTTAALFSGFYAIIAGTNGNFEYASIAIFIAMILDGLDGRVARLTNTTSAFAFNHFLSLNKSGRTKSGLFSISFLILSSPRCV